VEVLRGDTADAEVRGHVLNYQFFLSRSDKPRAGGGASACANYDAYTSGAMSGFEYTKSIVFGAATGTLASFAPGIVGGVLAGGTGSAANNLLSQSYTSDSINVSQVGSAFLAGATAGFAGGAGAKIGLSIINPIKNNTGILIRNHPYPSTGRGLPTANYGSVGGIIGNSIGRHCYNLKM
jgi:hypothetical protein